MSFCRNCGKELPDGAVCDCNNMGNSVQKRKNKFIVPVAAAAVVVVAVIGVSSLSGGYKKPVKDYVKAVNNCDMAKMLSVAVPESKMKELKKEAKDSIIDYDAFLDKMDDALEKAIEELEDDYGKNVKFSIKITDKEKVKGDDLNELKEEYENEFDAEIKKAYKINAEITIKGKDDKKTEDTSLYVVKVKGDDWKVYGFNNDMGLGDTFSSSLF
ncbi:MAG: hypothetical protein K2K89_08175 [Ruminococcus sp.]|nr:hypothetical protein [Ruminococcus sp.]